MKAFFILAVITVVVCSGILIHGYINDKNKFK